MGGSLYSPAVHVLDFFRHLLGDVVRVHALAAPQVLDNQDYADTVTVSMQFASGAFGCLVDTYAQPLASCGGDIVCQYGGAGFDLPPRGANRRIEYQVRGNEKVTLSIKGVSALDPVSHELRSFAQWVLHDKPPFIAPEDGLKAVEIIEAAYLSIERGEAVRLPLPRH